VRGAYLLQIPKRVSSVQWEQAESAQEDSGAPGQILLEHRMQRSGVQSGDAHSDSPWCRNLE